MSVRISTLCMTQYFFNGQFISAIIYCITIPVGQKFTYKKLTVTAWKIPENDVGDDDGFRSF